MRDSGEFFFNGTLVSGGDRCDLDALDLGGALGRFCLLCELAVAGFLLFCMGVRLTSLPMVVFFLVGVGEGVGSCAAGFLRRLLPFVSAGSSSDSLELSPPENSSLSLDTPLSASSFWTFAFAV